MIKKEIEIGSNGEKLYVTIDNHFDTKIYYKDEQYDVLHREDGPAILYQNGDGEWYKNGIRHREGGPAIDYTDGSIKEWWVNGKRHREDGPAIEYKSGYRFFYLNGVNYREEYYWAIVRLGSFV